MIQLFVNIYQDPEPVRGAELEEAFQRNVCLFAGRGTILPIKGNPTFGEIFRTIKQYGNPYAIHIVANADICFDETLFNLEDIPPDAACVLTRWDQVEGRAREAGVYVEDLSLFCDENDNPRCDSQDAWVFRGPIRQSLIDACDFRPGVRGCDNRLAYEIHKAGYKIANPGLDIRAIHLHRSGIRRYGHEPGDCVPKPYLLIDPHHLGETPKLRFCF